MIALKDELVEIGSITRKEAYVVLELEDPSEATDNYKNTLETIEQLKHTHYGSDIVFVGRMGNSVILVCGTFHKYEEHVGQDFILRKLEIKGQAITYDS